MDGVSIYPIISLLIFVIFFITVMLYVMKMKKREIDELSQIPFELDEQELQNKITTSNN
jgi:cbb3-type cytochrome oxidase subunit 3